MLASCPGTRRAQHTSLPQETIRQKGRRVHAWRREKRDEERINERLTPL